VFGLRLAGIAACFLLAVAVVVAEPVARPGANESKPVAAAKPATPAATQPAQPTAAPAAPAPLPMAVAQASFFFMVRYDHWSESDEKSFGEFLTSIGDSECRTVNSCLEGAGNPFRSSDPSGVYFRADCADLPYVLRAYYAWKRGLPFSYESNVEPRGRSRDIRYSRRGNEVTSRTDVLSGSVTGFGLMETLSDNISSAYYRVPPGLEEPYQPDHYSPAIDPRSIKPGTIVYDPNGHLAIVYRIEADGRIHYMDAHPDNSLTRGLYDLRFVRASPAMSAGFKNWRPMKLVGYTRRADGALVGGHVVLSRNADIANYSEEQYFGNAPHPWDDSQWRMGGFRINGQLMDYYDYVRAKLAGGVLQFDPVKEVADMVDSNCADLHYRADAITVALAAGIQNQGQPDRLPANIYGTEGDWETYSTPSRDARLKTAFKELRDQTQRFVELNQRGDRRILYRGSDLIGDLTATYQAHAAKCSIAYKKTDGAWITFGYEQARQRLFLMSFDPYHCVERRWGATEPAELASCRDGSTKRAWYAAEQNLRNQIDRTYEAQMDFDLDELGRPGAGKGVAVAPDTDTLGYLIRLRGGASSRASAF
jgi:hypothetical protein